MIEEGDIKQRVLDIRNRGDRNIHIWLDGVDVSKDTYHAVVPVDEGVNGLGEVWIYLRNAQGIYYPDVYGNAAREIRVGTVRWERIPKVD